MGSGSGATPSGIDCRGSTGSDTPALAGCAPASPCWWSERRVAAIGSAGRAADDVVVSVRVAASSDDAEEFSDGFIYLNSSDIELVTDNTSLQTVGLRFTGLAIPPGAEITTAWIQFTTDEPSTTPTNLVIAAHKTTNAPTFSPTQPITTRPTTAATTTWQPAPWPTIGQSTTTQRTPDIAGLIQELVNQPTWTLTSPIAVIITGTGTAESHDGDPNAAALLHITYPHPPRLQHTPHRHRNQHQHHHRPTRHHHRRRPPQPTRTNHQHLDPKPPDQPPPPSPTPTNPPPPSPSPNPAPTHTPSPPPTPNTPPPPPPPSPPPPHPHPAGPCASPPSVITATEEPRRLSRRP